MCRGYKHKQNYRKTNTSAARRHTQQQGVCSCFVSNCAPFVAHPNTQKLRHPTPSLGSNARDLQVDHLPKMETHCKLIFPCPPGTINTNSGEEYSVQSGVGIVNPISASPINLIQNLEPGNTTLLRRQNTDMVSCLSCIHSVLSFTRLPLSQKGIFHHG
jgi:hypothetical protein